MEDDECLAEFRVRKNDLPRLAEALQIPNEFTCEQRSVIPGIEGLCMLLKRLAYPCRHVDMLPRFGRPLSVFWTSFLQLTTTESLSGMPKYSTLLPFKLMSMQFTIWEHHYSTALDL